MEFVLINYIKHFTQLVLSKATKAFAGLYFIILFDVFTDVLYGFINIVCYEHEIHVFRRNGLVHCHMLYTLH